MTNNPADAMRGVLRHVLGDLQASLDWRGADGKGHDKIVIDRAYAEIIARGLSAAKTGRDEVIEECIQALAVAMRVSPIKIDTMFEALRALKSAPVDGGSASVGLLQRD